MFLALKEIRARSVEDCASILKRRLEQDAPSFRANPRFGLWQSHKKTVRRVLARITHWLELQVGTGGNLAAYLTSSGAQGYDIEHVIANKHERHRDSFPVEVDFQEYRNRIGGLLLLPRSFNRSYGDLSYEDKRPHYLQQNMLAQTFHEQAYERNPGLKRVIVEKDIQFEPYVTSAELNLDRRQTVLTRLAEEVWSTDRLDTEACVGSSAR
jgi:Protein of unknown function (DUF1524)